jgi:hypothetical protein
MPPPHGRYNILDQIGILLPNMRSAEHGHRFYQWAANTAASDSKPKLCIINGLGESTGAAQTADSKAFSPDLTQQY